LKDNGRIGQVPLKDVIQEAERILSEAERQNIVLRLLGGVAVGARCPSAAKEPSLRRSYADVDLIGHKEQAKPIKALFQGLGYEPRQRFNAMFGDERLVFNDLENERRVDIFLDMFRMCHTFDLRKRLEVDKRTLPLADLVATKLQVVEATEREYKDTMCLLLDHEVGDSDDYEIINGKYLARMGAEDWGVYTTFKKSLERMADYMKPFPLEGDKKTIINERMKEIERMLDQEPKSLKWKMRSAVGEKKVWYDLPEADKKVVD
jgi:hypothetical protein